VVWSTTSRGTMKNASEAASAAMRPATTGARRRDLAAAMRATMRFFSSPLIAPKAARLSSSQALQRAHPSACALSASLPPPESSSERARSDGQPSSLAVERAPNVSTYSPSPSRPTANVRNRVSRLETVRFETPRTFEASS